MKICKNCKWFELWAKDDPKEVVTCGSCHRYPPDQLIKDKKFQFYMFKDVDDDDWCGEFKAKGE